MESDATGATSCVICLEVVESGVTLPCKCSVPYCSPCWDRSLARGLSACGVARCPTCRSAIRVDFDTATGKVIYSTGPEAEEDDDDAMQDAITNSVGSRSRASSAAAASSAIGADSAELQAQEETTGGLSFVSALIAARALSAMPTAVLVGLESQAPASGSVGRRPQPARMMERLADQARPAQIRLLTQVGDADRELRAAAIAAMRRRQDVSIATDASFGTLSPAAGRQALLAEQARARQMLQDVSSAAAAAPKLPPCVCGGQLAHVSYRERLVRYVQMQLPNVAASAHDLDQHIDRRLERGDPCYFCDLCGQSSCEGGVWTCESGNNTVLHANAYDVCELCFAKYCAGAPDAS